MNNKEFIEKNVEFKKNIFTNENTIEFVKGVSELPMVNPETGDILGTLTDLLINDKGITYENVSKVVFPETLHKIDKGFVGIWYGEEDMEMFSTELDFSKCEKVVFESEAFTGLSTDVLYLPEMSYVCSTAFKNCAIDKLVVGKGTNVKQYAFYDCCINDLEIETGCKLVHHCFSQLEASIHDLKIADNVTFKTHDDGTKTHPIDYFFDAQKAFLYSYNNATSKDEMTLLGYGQAPLLNGYSIANHFRIESSDYIREEEIPVLFLQDSSLENRYFIDFVNDLNKNIGTDDVVWKDLAIGREGSAFYINREIPSRPKSLERLLLSNEFKELRIQFLEGGLKKISMIMAEGAKRIILPEEKSFNPVTVVCNKTTEIINKDRHLRMQIIRTDSANDGGNLSCTIAEDSIKVESI